MINRRLVLTIDVQSWYFLLFFVFSDDNYLLIIVIDKRHLLFLHHMFDFRLEVPILLEKFIFHIVLQSIVLFEVIMFLANVLSCFFEVDEPAGYSRINVVPRF